ncbi:MAG: hypothetical protein FWB95_02025 [Treponema sp.]|nr:hypothetical protein [Treponema sp.]
MNKRINFEDTLFILNVRIRMIRDLMRLDTDSGLFYNQTMSDLEFISAILDMLTARFLENLKILDREVEADNIFDAEWQFSQLLNEISNNTSPFAPSLFPETPIVVSKLKTDSVKRKKLIDDSYVPAESIVTEQVVTNEELNGLLGSSA